MTDHRGFDMFTRVAVLDRGEAAMRFIHAAREFDTGGDPLVTIALHTDADRRAMFVREADEAVRIASSTMNPYLDCDELDRALSAAGAEAAWVGWGFVAEQPDFAELCQRSGVVFIGPPAGVMRRLGNKIEAKRLAEQAGIAVARWSGGPVENLAEARSAADAIGYPLVVKAASGGGGRGIRLVQSSDQLAHALERARAEAAAAFSDPTVFMEQLVTGARHVECQIIADDHGNVWAAGIRDCTVQRGDQKLMEESASTALSDAQAEAVRDAAVRLAKAADYRNAGTVEFLYQPHQERLAFLEVITRLQVEHPVTEATTGLDLVKLQLHVARGGRLEGDPPSPRGHAIEVRLHAEDPHAGFSPAPGRVEHLVWPSGPGTRVDTGVAQGDVMAPEYDSMIAKVLAWGENRDEARLRLRRALAETTVLIAGGTTNKAFLFDLLGHPDVVAGNIDTAWLDRLMAAGQYPCLERADVALLATAIDAYDDLAEVDRNRFYTAAARGRPEASPDVGHIVDLSHAGAAYRMTVTQIGPSRYRVVVDGSRIDVAVERVGRFERRLTVAGRRFRVMSIGQGAETLVEVGGVPHRIAHDDGGMVRAPSPGVVVAVRVAVGDLVEAGTAVAVIESMKIEAAVAAPVAGRVREVLVTPNTQVDAGAPLVHLEAVLDDAQTAAAGDHPRADFADLAATDTDPPDAAVRATSHLEGLRCLLLGFDSSVSDARRLVDDFERASLTAPPGDAGLLGAELDLLSVFADLCLLSRNRRTDSNDEGEEAHNPREYFHAYLHTLDAERAGLPPTFTAKLRRASAHFGVGDLERTPELEDSLYRIYLAQQRAPSQLPAVLAVLQRLLAHPAAFPEALRQRFLDTLDRLIVATQLRHPVVGELARTVRFQCFDKPLIAAERDRDMTAMRGHLAALASRRERPDHAELMRLLVDCPRPLIDLMAELGDEAAASQRHLLIEVLTRRYYQIRPLQQVRSFSRDGRAYVTADYLEADQPVHVVATDMTGDELFRPGGPLAAVAADVAASTAAVVDLYVTWDQLTPPPAQQLGQIGQALDGSGLATKAARVTLTVTSPPSVGNDIGVSRFTFEPGDNGFCENRALRNLHPMIAERLQLWRLVNFNVTRLASPDHVSLFDCVGRDTPGDQRLIALAEVRDLAALRDGSGAVAAVPELEHVLGGCLDAIRQALIARPAKSRPQWNRVVLYVWPTIDLPLDELVPVVRTLAATTDGLGLEQVIIQGRAAQPGGDPREIVVRVSRPPGSGLTIRVTDPPTEALRPIDAYSQKVLAARRRGAVYPYELIPSLIRAPADPVGAAGSFVEYDLDGQGRLAPVERPYGTNTAAIVVGTVTAPTSRYPDGMTRVALFGDPTKALGSVAEPECHRVVAALDLAEQLGVPVEWFAVSSGAKIAMDSGTENMDWVSRALRRIIEFTQAGGEINVIVAGINVGAQPYWNAEATMLMHTRGILVMTPDSAMVLTGKQALEYSGGVAAEDNFGIGGYDTVMGPNGQAQYWAADLAGAVEILFAHYHYSYVAPGERFPRPAVTDDPVERDVRTHPHDVDDVEFVSVGDIFSPDTNPDRKKPFDIRTLIRATVDQDHPPLERWPDMKDAETAVVFDACLGGQAVSIIGVESRPLARLGLLPPNGPNQWTAGTLFPRSSKKLARAINAASGNRPLVVLANLSGFDGSPESLGNLQLEYGAEIGRAIVNFDGPIVFCVVSRYHGGAFVVFSGTLNENIEVAAVESSYASVIGGTPAAAVVFAGEVTARTEADPRLGELQARITKAESADTPALRAQLATLRAEVRAEKLGAVADEFDKIHSIQRALEVGSIHTIIPAARLRPYLIDAVERGVQRTHARHAETTNPPTKEKSP